MDGADTATLTGSLPGALGFLGEVLFRWVPATIIAAFNTSPLNAATSTVLSAPGIPDFFARTSDPATYDALTRGWFIFAFITLVSSLPFFAVAVYCAIRIVQIRRQEELGFRAAQQTVKAEDIPKTQLRWNRVLDQINADTPESWRLAVLEADIMLNELLDIQGYKGETMAEKMKQVDRATFNSIDLAWEAHKIRNRIAHEGSEHVLSAREARRVVALYEKVFKEFRYIE